MQTIVIKKVGEHYSIHEDILCGTIIIAANDVILNGNNFCIRQADTTAKGCFAIQIQEGCTNVKILDLVIKDFSGGGIWIKGSCSKITVRNVKFSNCSYLGQTVLDSKRFPANIPKTSSQNILVDGGHGKPINGIQIIDCTFFESGILRRKGEQGSRQHREHESNVTSILIYEASNIIIQGITIDGCVGGSTAYGMTLTAISNMLIKDVFITDVYSSGLVQPMCIFDADADIKDFMKGAIIPYLNSSKFEEYLDIHPSVRDPALPEDFLKPIEACHLKKVIPRYIENEEQLVKEHKWREFRTMYRLVCHNAHKKSKTSAAYAKWVELFCEKVFGVKVRVESGFANLYLNGSVCLPLHRDQYHKWIFGLSFGETRTLDFLPDNKDLDIISYPMEAGDVLLFSPKVNDRFQHRMLAEPEKNGRRVNLTYFMEVLPGQDESKLLHPPENMYDIVSNISENFLKMSAI
jgi:alkylated DNA repair dioxygenase AlkB